MQNLKKKQDRPGLNLLCNIVIPAIILLKGSKWFGLSPEIALLAALLFPITYGVRDLVVKKQYNFLSIVGFISILLTGIIGLLKLPKEWIAIKEAAIPFILGLAILFTLKMRSPLVRLLLYNDSLLQTDKIDYAIEEKGNKQAFNNLMQRATFLLSLSFFLSAFLNYVLAKKFIHSETGTQAFTEELGRMTAWSYPVIALPCTIVLMIVLWKLVGGIEELSGLKKEEIFVINK